MLIADELSIKGRHAPLLDPTSLKVASGELLLVHAEPQTTRTALALALSARMRPDAGTVAWEGDPALDTVRGISMLVDSPEINEPEAHLKVRDLVSEDLALHPGPFWRRSSIDSWLERHRITHLAGEFVDAIDPLDRQRILTHLALEGHDTSLLIFDTPDRHGINDGEWVAHLEQTAAGRRQPAIVAVVRTVPDEWTGPVAEAGANNLPHPTESPE
ncbi:MAG: ABC transporter ATP-binding protein [Arthrobacter sp.]|uniref:ABC transporter ATP-binding protein n=1 Tax=Arthrobacter sp. AOP36-C1-22 TaxID=3457683 RepID=UPI00264FB646|nr:ABC transporter ATP-binding protein [Micrococcaceae bacterium]MDN5878225.1 ABC transporter ATP-binding protein [Micrococcaceae bacterium]MDN5885825.1 ABC transporter ATP-binding protein [Micrococcaceae bacterium]